MWTRFSSYGSWFLLILAVLSTTGCWWVRENSAWIQEKVVPLGTVNFNQCVKAAVVDVDGVKLGRDDAPWMILLDIDFKRPNPLMHVEVQLRKNNEAHVMFVRLGTYPKLTHEEVEPWLDRITDAIDRKCGVAQTQQ